MVQRNEYLKQLIKWKYEQVIKVVTGIRRCGKSTLLEMYQDYLKTQGIGNDQIVSINFEELEYEDLWDYRDHALYRRFKATPRKARGLKFRQKHGIINPWINK